MPQRYEETPQPPSKFNLSDIQLYSGFEKITGKDWNFHENSLSLQPDPYLESINSHGAVTYGGNLYVTERRNIADENKKFTNYVQGTFVDDFWWK